MSDHIYPRAVDPATFPGAFSYACPGCGSCSAQPFPCAECVGLMPELRKRAANLLATVK